MGEGVQEFGMHSIIVTFVMASHIFGVLYNIKNPWKIEYVFDVKVIL